MRYMIEGTWFGYTSSMDRVVHREVITDANLATFCEKTFSISFTDGTSLGLAVREMKKSERAKNLKHSYGSLIRDCYRNNVTSVSELMALKKEVTAK